LTAIQTRDRGILVEDIPVEDIPVEGSLVEGSLVENQRVLAAIHMELAVEAVTVCYSCPSQ
jgi:hypothetical protein